MKRLFEFAKTTVIGGLVVILPVAVLLVLLERVVVAVRAALAPLAAYLPVTVLLPALVATLILVAACFFAGLAVRTRLGRTVGGVIERSVLERVPGYALLRSVSRRVVGGEEGGPFAAALAEMGGGLVPCFLVEEHEDGSDTVFVPVVPTPTVGSVYILPRALVHRVDVPFRKAVKCVTQWGAGSGELLRAMRGAPPGARVSDPRGGRP
jgi:uncharacterized membrane protein